MAEKLAAPIVVTLKAKEVFGWDNPYQVGQTGLVGNPAAAKAMAECDALLMIGTDFPYRDWYPKGAKVIQVDTAADHLGRRTQLDLGLVGDAGLTAKALADRVGGERDRRRLEALVGKYQVWKERQSTLADPAYRETATGRVARELDDRSHRIRPEAVAAAAGELAAGDAVFTSDTGMSTVWLAKFVEMQQGQRLLGSYNLGSMANAMPQAIGAACAYPGRQVVAFCGDGGLTMLLGDLLTIVRYKLNVKLVVFDNHRLGMVKLEQEQAGLPEFGTVLPNPDLAEVAWAMGMNGKRITDPARLHDQLAEAFALEGPVLVDVLTNPQELAVPGEVHPGQAWGFAIAKIKETLRSQGDEG